MPLTAQQQTDIYKCAVAMYVAAPGVVYMNELAQFLVRGNSIVQLYDALADAPSFQQQNFGFSRVATNHEFATAFVDGLVTYGGVPGPDITPVPSDASRVAASGSALTAENRSVAVAFVEAMLDSGMSRGASTKAAVDVLDAISHTDSKFGAAAKLLDLRVDGARYYTETLSVSATSLSTLQQYIKPLTPDGPLPWDGITITQPVTFALTTGTDELIGSSSADRFVARVDNDGASSAQATLNAGDVLNGGQSGDDTLELSVTGTHTGRLVISGFTLANVESVNVSNSETTDFETVIDFSDAAGVSRVSLQGTATGDTAIVSVQSRVGASMTGVADLRIEYASAAVAGDADTQALTLAGQTGGLFTADGIEIIELSSQSSANRVTVAGNATRAIYVSGYAPLDLQSLPIGVTTVEAAALAEKLTLSAGGTTDRTIRVGIGHDEIDLSESSGNNRVSGGAGNDYVRPGSGNDTIDGGTWLDTVEYTGSSLLYSAQRDLDTGALTVAWTGGGRVETDSLAGVERLHFSDRKFAFDLANGEAASNSVRLTGAAFGRDAIAQRPEWVGDGLRWFDLGLTMEDVAQHVLETPAYVAQYGAQTNREFVATVFRNTTGTDPSAELQGRYEAMLASGTTRAQLLGFAANSEENAIHIDLAGLLQTGLEFV